MSSGRTNTTVVRIDDESDVGAARRTAGRLGNAAGLNESELGLLAIAVTEAATNIARHGGEGMIFFRLSDVADDAGVEMIAVDKGPGIRDIGRALTDGYSTRGTPGNGLGAISRA
ncbi:MAG TPA: ATP-binding protein, partial [Gemmatimonadaceae bacterium]|nr:ATP-binding protein [Gemmatimonadaceae bacterium]